MNWLINRNPSSSRLRTIATIIVAAVLAVALGLWLLWSGTHKGADENSAGSAAGSGGRKSSLTKGGQGAGSRPIAVSVAKAARGNIQIWAEAIGTAQPKNLVTVRSRVDGTLMRLHFSEGQKVVQGQPLADIDPRPFAVQLSQMEGQSARDEAQLANARADLARYRTLWEQDAISKQQLDTQAALVDQFIGVVASDKAAIDSARLQLDFAHITAPISGRLGLRQVDPGNQIHAADVNGIVVIAQVQPMTVVFSLPEALIPDVRSAQTNKNVSIVQAWESGRGKLLATGRLLAIDNQIDIQTGTVKIKAEFANADESLFPNQFLNIRLLLGERNNTLIVPSAAILRGANGPYIYWVDADSKARMLPVILGPTQDEQVAIEGNLEVGAAVVIDGADKLRDGSALVVTEPSRIIGGVGSKVPSTDSADKKVPHAERGLPASQRQKDSRLK